MAAVPRRDDRPTYLCTFHPRHLPQAPSTAPSQCAALARRCSVVHATRQALAVKDKKQKEDMDS